MASKNDWQAIERDYRLNVLSNVLLGKKHGVSEAAIRKRAKAEGWVRDLTAEVNNRVRAKLVRGEVRVDPVKDEEAVEQAANSNVVVINTHRRDIRTAAETCAMLMGQLVEAATHRDEIEEDIREETKEDINGQRRSRMLKAISLPQHASTMLNLSAAVKNLVTLERIAFNLDDRAEGASYEEELQALIDGKESAS